MPVALLLLQIWVLERTGHDFLCQAWEQERTWKIFSSFLLNCFSDHLWPQAALICIFYNPAKTVIMLCRVSHIFLMNLGIHISFLCLWFYQGLTFGRRQHQPLLVFYSDKKLTSFFNVVKWLSFLLYTIWVFNADCTCHFLGLFSMFYSF